MKIREPIPRWNNFTVHALKEILEHYRALETLGIAQDEKMIAYIERDIALRQQIPGHYPNYKLKNPKLKHQKAKQKGINAKKKQLRQGYLLLQNA